MKGRIRTRRQWWKRTFLLTLSLLLVMSNFATLGILKKVQAEEPDIYYVHADNGDDETNDGSESLPFATIGKAFEEIGEQGTIVLLSDVTLDKKLEIKSNPGKNVTIQSKENEKYTIKRDENFTGTLIEIDNRTSAKLVFKNLIIDGNNVSISSYGVENNYSDTTFENVEIRNHHIAGGAGTAVISSYGNGSTVTIKGDETKIHQNTITHRHESNPASILGAGTTGVLIIEGGTITDNTVTGNSNGVIVGVGLYLKPRLQMTGGTITGNKLHGNEYNANGETVGNVAVYMRGSSSQARFEFSGTPFVYNNLNSNNEQRNVFLKNTAARDNAFLSLVGKMEDGAKVGVYAQIMPTNDNPIVDLAIGHDGYEVTEDDANYFESDLETSAVVGFDNHNEKKKVVLIPVPRLESAWMDKTEVDGKDITFIFSDPIQLEDLSGFKIEVGGTEVTPASHAVDPDDKRKLKVTLAEEPNANIVVTYTQNAGNLKGTNGIAVEDFTFTYDISFATELDITAPTGDPAEVIESKPVLSGTTKAGSTVNVVVKDIDGNVVVDAGGSATVDGITWSFESSTDLGTGTYTFEVTATSPDGKISVTKTKEIEVNRLENLLTITEPSAETVTTARPEIKGEVEADSTVQVTIKNQSSDTVASGSATVTGTTWTYTPTVDLENGNYTIEVTATKNGKTATKTKNMTVTVADGTPTVTLTTPTENTVNTGKPTFSGTATPGATITVKLAEGNELTTIADENGNWSVIPTEDLADGTYDIKITAEKDGETSTPVTKELTIDTTDIGNLQLNIVEPLDSTLTISKPVIKGTVTTDATITIEITDENGTIVQSSNTIPVNNGIWSYTPDIDLADGNYTVKVTATNNGGSKIATKKITIATATLVDKTLLQEEVAISSSLNEEDYTLESWSVYQIALSSAQAVLANPNATQAEVDAALATLTAARNNLERAGNDPENGLISLTPSQGTLNPSFSKETTSYSMNVPNSTTTLSFNWNLIDPNSEITMLVNGQLVNNNEAALNVGTNIIVITVKNSNNDTIQYTITVNRADSGSSSGSGGGGGSSSDDSNQEQILVPVETGAVLEGEVVEQTPINRMRENGVVKDDVTFTRDRVAKAIENVKKSNQNTARIIIPDEKDEVSQVDFTLPNDSRAELANAKTNLEIYTENVRIMIPESSLASFNRDLYFRLVPIKEVEKRNEVENRARVEQIVKEISQNQDVYVVSRPMTIETNLQSHPVTLTLPLRDVEIPTNAVEREQFFNRLVIFVEHSNGDKQLIKPEVVEYNRDLLGLQFNISKFSTFTILSVDGNYHHEYIVGFTDGTFKPSAHVTRAEMAAMLARNLGYEGDKNIATPFKDVGHNHWASGVIQFVYEQGLMVGLTDNEFGANEKITRAQMVVIVARYKQLTLENELSSEKVFHDIRGHWAVKEIAANKKYGIITGFEDGTYRPNQALTRAEAVKMVNRMFNRGPLYGINDSLFPDVPTTHWAYHEIAEAAYGHFYTSQPNGGETIIN